MKKAFFALTALLFALVLTAGKQTKDLDRPMPVSQIERIGVAEMRYFAPIHLQEAARDMTQEVRRYDDARRAFRAELASDPHSKYAYIALCKLDTNFRETEFARWRNIETTDTSKLFQKCASAYLHYLPFLYSDAERKLPARPDKAAFLLNRNKGTLALATALWDKEPDLWNGVLLAAIKIDIGDLTNEPEFTSRLIALSGGDKAASQYQAARSAGWMMTPPDRAGWDKEKAWRFIGAMANPIAAMSTGNGSKNPDEIVNRRGDIIAVYSDQQQEWTFPQKGTELGFLGEWRRALKKAYKLP